MTETDLFDGTLGFFARYDNEDEVDVVGFDDDDGWRFIFRHAIIQCYSRRCFSIPSLLK